MTPYFEDSGITIFHGRAEDVLPTLEGVDLIFTSPPYNLGNTSGGGFPGKAPWEHYDPDGGMAARSSSKVGKWGGGHLVNGYTEHDDNMPHAEYVAWQHAILNLCWNALSDKGAIYYNHKPRVISGRAVLPTEYNPNLPLRQIVIWARAGGINYSAAFYCPTHEWIMVMAREAWRLKSKAASGAGDVWYVPQEANPNHPAPFPSELPRRAIETTAPRFVCDPFMGIGTTIIEAKKAGIPAIGIDTSEEYCERAVEVLQKTRRKRSLFTPPPPAPEQTSLF